MRPPNFTKPPNLTRLLFAVLALSVFLAPARAQDRAGAERLLPEKIGEFQARGRSAPPASARVRSEDFGVMGAEARSYFGPGGEGFSVALIKTRSSSAAYSLLRHFANHPDSSAHAEGLTPARLGTIDGLGLTGAADPDRVRFIKGDAFADVRAINEQAQRPGAVREFAGLFAETLPGEPGDIPVLVLHLPEWEKKVSEGIGYAVSLPVLQQSAGGRPVLEALSFEGGTEAVTARYGAAQLVVVEFTTPQHSVEADALVNERIAQLRAAGQPVPSLYRRVGNYSVFVFDAPDAEAAQQLASGVKYEKDVRWLGRNPHADEIIARRYTSTMGGVILTTLITTGLAILLCLGVGGAVGGVVFLRRRAKTTEQEAFSDAGGMMRLNLEDLNTPGPPANLLGHGKE